MRAGTTRGIGALAAALVATALGALAAGAGEAEVLEARAEREAGGTFRFAVTVRHADQGWDHYANAYEVLAPDGSVLGTRVLRHPHVDEQPFTRRLRGVEVPEGVARVRVRARDSVHGHGGETREVLLPGREAEPGEDAGEG